MNEPKIAYIGLGSNLGDRNKNIEDALKMLAEADGIRLLRTSDIIETTPLAGAEQPRYLNTVAELATELNIKDFHAKLSSIETALGRTRNVKWAPRTIDLDLLFFGDGVINQKNLTVPHPQLHLRTFVLKGLCQLNANLVHPIMKVPIATFFARLNNTDFILDSSIPQLISIAGLIGSGKTTLAEKLKEQLNSPVILEPYSINPYLPLVYGGKFELALDSQLFFLIHRYEQLNGNALEAGKIYISDYLFDKELIYANVLLNSQQMQLYRPIFDQYSPKITPPVLVIYLMDSPESCLERIHRRNRPYEQKIDVAFLEKILAGHEELLAAWKKSPVIRIKTAELDYSRPQIIENLAEQVKCYITAALPKQKQKINV